MKRIIATGILSCVLLGAGAAGAGPVSKFTFQGLGPLTDTSVSSTPFLLTAYLSTTARLP